jgi:hypothetical protein
VSASLNGRRRVRVNFHAAMVGGGKVTPPRRNQVIARLSERRI